MVSSSRSLMDFIAAPVLVGDPEGRAVYVNPAFVRDFETDVDSVAGLPLANLFEGGGREAVLRAVASVCRGEATSRFRLRAGARGYVAIASPVEVEGGRVGVILLLTDEPTADDRVQILRREILEPLDEVAENLCQLADPTASGADEKNLVRIADCVRAVDRMRKWADDAAGRLSGDE